MTTPIIVPLNEKQLTLLQNIMGAVTAAQAPYDKALTAQATFFDTIGTLADTPVPNGSRVAVTGSTITFTPPDSILISGDLNPVPPAQPPE